MKNLKSLFAKYDFLIYTGIFLIPVLAAAVCLIVNKSQIF